jgi:hypothetical protein
MLFPVATAADSIIADHSAVAQFHTIPDSLVGDVKATYSIFYGHTSHGSQIVSGMSMLYDEDSLYRYNDGAGSLQLSEYSGDLGHNGDTSWVPITRQQLDEPGSDFNIVVWSWCGGVSDNTETGINAYLEAMDGLEQDYPDVTFVYMTGHLDFWGSETLHANNELIREYCRTNGKILFDFADIESYDPDGNYYPDDWDVCNWCSEWCTTHTCPTCSECAHSHCFNCYLKGKAFWWMLAKMAGSWECCSGSYTGNVNCDPEDEADLADIVLLIDYVYTSPAPLCCPEEANVNGDVEGKISLADIIRLIDHVYVSQEPTAPCP